MLNIPSGVTWSSDLLNKKKDPEEERKQNEIALLREELLAGMNFDSVKMQDSYTPEMRQADEQKMKDTRSQSALLRSLGVVADELSGYSPEALATMKVYGNYTPEKPNNYDFIDKLRQQKEASTQSGISNKIKEYMAKDKQMNDAAREAKQAEIRAKLNAMGQATGVFKQEKDIESREGEGVKNREQRATLFDKGFRNRLSEIGVRNSNKMTNDELAHKRELEKIEKRQKVKVENPLPSKTRTITPNQQSNLIVKFDEKTKSLKDVIGKIAGLEDVLGEDLEKITPDNIPLGRNILYDRPLYQIVKKKGSRWEATEEGAADSAEVMRRITGIFQSVIKDQSGLVVTENEMRQTLGAMGVTTTNISLEDKQGLLNAFETFLKRDGTTIQHLVNGLRELKEKSIRNFRGTASAYGNHPDMVEPMLRHSGNLLIGEDKASRYGRYIKGTFSHLGQAKGDVVQPIDNYINEKEDEEEDEEEVITIDDVMKLNKVGGK